MNTELSNERTIYRVSEITRRIKLILEREIGGIWLEGELSNFRRPSSGHWYFTLKDDQAQIRAAFFKNRQRDIPFTPRDGLQVRVFGALTVFERSGQYQIAVHSMEEVGRGSLHAAFEALKKKLTEEGLFDPGRKKALPLLPRRIGIVTSPTGAVIRDMLNILSRRFPDLHIILAPVRVQGAGAAESMASAIDYFNDRNLVDVLIIGRGGGSLEDLWAFNEEVLARAIARSHLPVISAVGHETDFSISDFVADLRAPTPSAAAELVIAPKAEFEQRIQHVEQRLIRVLDAFRLQIKNRYQACRDHWVFKEPSHLIQRQRVRIEGCGRDMRHALTAALRERQQRADEAALQLRHLALLQRQEAQNRLRESAHQLRLLNPRAVLERGYSITRTVDGRLVRARSDVQEGEPLVTLLTNGRIFSTVTGTENEVNHAE